MVRGLVVCFSLIFLAACGAGSREIELSGPTMGTTYLVRVIGAPPGIDAAAVRTVIDQELGRIDVQMSRYRDDSEISRFNSSPSTDWVGVSAELATVVQRALDIGEASGGVLDVTVAPLVDLWGFGPRGTRTVPPDQSEIEAVRGDVGFGGLHTRLDRPALRKDSARLRIDLNAVAPGFAVDAIGARLTALGIEHFMIDIGGEVMARGRNADDEFWRIAVERPVDATPTPYAIVRLANASVATSGEYRQYFSHNGHRYSHTIDPRTGWPVSHSGVAVVVIAPTTLEADAWATALNVLGPDAGHALATQRGVTAMFVLQDGARLRPRMTAGFEDYLAVPPER